MISPELLIPSGVLLIPSGELLIPPGMEGFTGEHLEGSRSGERLDRGGLGGVTTLNVLECSTLNVLESLLLIVFISNLGLSDCVLCILSMLCEAIIDLPGDLAGRTGDTIAAGERDLRTGALKEGLPGRLDVDVLGSLRGSSSDDFLLIQGIHEVAGTAVLIELTEDLAVGFSTTVMDSLY